MKSNICFFQLKTWQHFLCFFSYFLPLVSFSISPLFHLLLDPRSGAITAFHITMSLAPLTALAFLLANEVEHSRTRFWMLGNTEKLLVLSRVGSGKHENKKQPKTTLLVVLEPKTKTDSQGNYNPTSSEILGETLSLKGASVHHRSSQLPVSSNHRSNSETVNCRTWTLEMLKLSSSFICHDSQGRPTRPYPGENWSSLFFWVFCPSFRGVSIRFFILT